MLKLGFIGSGNIARAHATAIRQGVRGIRIAAAADINPKNRKAFGREFDVPDLYDDYQRMIAEADLDAVSIALPTALHRKATVAAARAGLHVFCEKPMALTLRDCDAMINACEKAGVKLMIAHVRRYDNTWGALRKLILSNAIGRPVLWRAAACGGPKQAWFLDAEIGGGPYIDGCVHNYEFANHIFGEPLEAVGSLLNLHPSTAPDTGVMVVRYKSGDEIMLAWCWGQRGVHSQGTTMDVIGPKGVILFPGYFPDSEFPEDFNHETHGAFLVKTKRGARLARFRKNSKFVDELKDFRDAILKDRDPIATPAEARKAIAVARAVFRAGETRRPAKVS